MENLQFENVSDTGYLMSDLGIAPERCEELCGLVEDILQQNPSQSVAKALAEVSKHAKTPQELSFLSVVIGNHASSGYAMSAAPDVFEKVISEILSGVSARRNSTRETAEATLN